MNDFRNALQSRVEAIIEKLCDQPACILVSGGSISMLILHAWAAFTPTQLKRHAVYIQFDDFIWLERENARQVAKELGFDLVEIPISESQALSSMHGQGFDREKFWNSILSQQSLLQFGSLISGFCWPELVCVRNTATGLTTLQEKLSISPYRCPEHINFFAESKSPEWDAFRTDPLVQLFISLVDEIPFPNIRYWQDFVFQHHIESFRPCPAWKIEEYLRVSQ